jgi:outer membrane protein OmpA-like peptidoglycan-associated protein
LLCGLRKNNQYLIEFYIKSPHPVTDSVGIYFSSNDFLFERKPLYTITPSMFVKDDTDFRMKKDSSWQKVSLTYTARGNEVFFTLANFSKRDINGETGIEMENHFFVFIDNISLLPLDPNERICAGWQQAKREIYEQDERHQYLQRLVRTYRNNPPEVPVLSKTITLVRENLVLPDVLFESGKSEMQLDAFVMLDSFCNTIRDKMIDSLVVEGHTDSTGTEELNRRLSAGRANAVASYLNKCFVSSGPVMIVRGWGHKKPVESNSTPDGRRKNRRVDISLWLKEQN